MSRKFSKIALIALATTAFSPIHSALAQDDAAPAADESRRFNTVQVTAQRREQSQLDVPLSVISV